MRTIKHAIETGLDYLIRKQNPDGSFTDFSSSGFASVEWMTAHVCWILEQIPDFQTPCKRGAAYLASHTNTNGSWGFNSSLTGDCSTTSQALMVLKKQNLKIQNKTIRWLLQQQHNEGGFSTYPFLADSPFNNWSMPHDDTTLEVIEALTRLNLAPTQRSQAIDWIQRRLRNGPLVAFWWKSPAYIFWIQRKARIHSSYAIRMSLNLLPYHLHLVPNLPLLLYQISAHIGPNATVSRAVRSILENQKKDGSWPCIPCLKVPPLQTCFNSRAGSSPIYPGNERIFSTAHAVAALYNYDNFKCRFKSLNKN